MNFPLQNDFILLKKKLTYSCDWPGVWSKVKPGEETHIPQQRDWVSSSGSSFRLPWFDIIFIFICCELPATIFLQNFVLTVHHVLVGNFPVSFVFCLCLCLRYSFSMELLKILLCQICFYFAWWDFLSLRKSPWLYKCSPPFSCNIFITYFFTFMCVIHLRFVFVYGLQGKSSLVLFYTDSQQCQVCVLAKLCLLLSWNIIFVTQQINFHPVYYFLLSVLQFPQMKWSLCCFQSQPCCVLIMVSFVLL